MSEKPIRLEADARVNDGDLLHVGDLEFKVIHTPGHTKGGSSLYCEKSKCYFRETHFLKECGEEQIYQLAVLMT